MKYQEVEGDLIRLAKEGAFDVITHGCNCFCNMGAGIAPQMAKAFGTDRFKMEYPGSKGEITKLGQIDYELLHFSGWDRVFVKYPDQGDTILYSLYVINSYTQYNYGKIAIAKPIDYEALTLCLRKINHLFIGKHIGLPLIGCGLAGGDWNKVKVIIRKELKDMNVTVVHFKR